MKQINDILKQVKTLSESELKNISSQILQMLKSCNNSAPEAVVEKCRKCESNNIIRYGKDKNGKQKYKCKSCGTIFTETSYSVVANSHCSMETWKKYIELLLNRASLAECASKCGISVQTAFAWRHKILCSLKKDQSARVMSGIIETDETYISISYKGNHSKSKKFVMPREPFKRGSDSKSQIGSRACVLCAYERNGQTYGEVLGKGQPTIAMLSHAFGNRIMSESIVISDKSVSTKNYFNSKTDVELIQLMAHIRPKSMSSPPEVRGVYHIQNVNNLHNRLRRFMRPYNGVSTKYLDHYVNLFIWVENHKKIDKTNLDIQLMNYISEGNTYVRFSDVADMPPVPQVA